MDMATSKEWTGEGNDDYDDSNHSNDDDGFVLPVNRACRVGDPLGIRIDKIRKDCDDRARRTLVYSAADSRMHDDYRTTLRMQH